MAAGNDPNSRDVLVAGGGPAGIAAAAAAALAALRGTTPRALGAGPVREALIKQGVELFD